MIILGPSFSGKSTVAESISRDKDNNLVHIDAGDLIRNAARTDEKIRSLTSRGLLIPPEASLELVTDAIRKITKATPDKDIVLTGFPRQIENAEGLSEVFIPLIVIRFKVRSDEIIRRYESAVERKKRMDHSRAILRRRLKNYSSQETPVEAFYRRKKLLRTVNANRPPKEVYEEVLDLYEKAREKI